MVVPLTFVPSYLDYSTISRLWAPSEISTPSIREREYPPFRTRDSKEPSRMYTHNVHGDTLLSGPAQVPVSHTMGK